MEAGKYPGNQSQRKLHPQPLLERQEGFKGRDYQPCGWKINRKLQREI